MTRVLVALVEGYEARAGLKDRNRALTEYEIARRTGYTHFSYVEFSTTAERDQVRAVLEELERGGWVSQWQRAGRYDSFVPTELGMRRASTLGVVGRAQTAVEPAALGAAGEPPLPTAAPDAAAALGRIVQQLDEILALLRAIDARLGGDGRGRDR